MATVDTVSTQTTTGVDGNAYTSAVSNDNLTTDDFLKIMIEEIKNQDPTDPMDSSAMMDSQLKMSTIESNIEMADAMSSLQTAYANSALSTAASIIGYVVENGDTGEDGLATKFIVNNVENVDGDLYVNVSELTGYYDILQDADGNSIAYDANGFIYDTDGEQTAYRISLDSDNRFQRDDEGNLVFLDEDGNEISDDTTASYAYAGYQVMYSEDTQSLPLSSITKVG